MSSESLHEPYELLSPETRDMHRALVSLMEELDAVDWYRQRAEACGDDELRAVLEHNRDEEIEHAMMLLEWIRRHSPKLAGEARTYLFGEGPITELEHVATRGGASGEARRAGADGSLGIGSLRQMGDARPSE